jgi:hypothetical protein
LVSSILVRRDPEDRGGKIKTLRRVKMKKFWTFTFIVIVLAMILLIGGPTLAELFAKIGEGFKNFCSAVGC